jgi:DNA-binding response OmpR family regulator
MKGNGASRAGEPASTPLQFQTTLPHRILVVEDDLFIRRLTVAVLIRSGYKVDAADDGAAAGEALNANSYDLLITDNNMPEVSGVELLQKLRAAGMVLPVIMTTATLPKEEFTQNPRLQPAAILLKPVTVAEILKTVKNVLRETDSAAAA